MFILDTMLCVSSSQVRVQRAVPRVGHRENWPPRHEDACWAASARRILA